MTQPVLGVAHGIEFVFDQVHKPLAADSAISQQGVAAILAYYQHLSRDVYGFEVSAEGALTALAKASLPDAPLQAMAVLTEASTALPTNHSLKFELATIQASQGKNAAAAKQLEQALTLTDHPFCSIITSGCSPSYRPVKRVRSSDFPCGNNAFVLGRVAERQTSYAIVFSIICLSDHGLYFHSYFAR